SPEPEELVDDIVGRTSFLPVATSSLAKLSPANRGLLEIRNNRDLSVLEKVYENSVLIGDVGADGWRLNCATEFHMTGDSKLFPSVSSWETRGYRADEYGRWIKLSGLAPHGAPQRDGGYIRLMDGSGFVEERQ